MVIVPYFIKRYTIILIYLVKIESIQLNVFKQIIVLKILLPFEVKGNH